MLHRRVLERIVSRDSPEEEHAERTGLVVVFTEDIVKEDEAGADVKGGGSGADGGIIIGRGGGARELLKVDLNAGGVEAVFSTLLGGGVGYAEVARQDAPFDFKVVQAAEGLREFNTGGGLSGGGSGGGASRGGSRLRRGRGFRLLVSGLKAERKAGEFICHLGPGGGFRRCFLRGCQQGRRGQNKRSAVRLIVSQVLVRVAVIVGS